MKRAAIRRVMSLPMVCALALSFVPFGSSAAPVPAGVQTLELRSDQADAAIKEKIDDDLFDPSVISELNARALMKYKATSGWGCLQTRVAGPGPVQVRPSGVVAGDAFVLEVGVDVSLGGNVQRTAFKAEIFHLDVDELEREVAAALGTLLDQAVDELAGRGVKPCNFGLKAKGKLRTSAQGVNWEASFDGEARLALTEDGTFSGSMPIVYAWSPITVPSGSCTIGGNSQTTMDIEGQFDGSGALEFTRLETQGLSGTVTANCTVAGQTARASLAVPSGSGDAAAGRDVRIPFQDGADTTTSFRAAGAENELRLDLFFEEGGTSVAAAPDATS